MLAGDGTPLTETGGALDVNIASGADFDIRDLSHTQDSVRIGDGTDLVEVNADGSLNVVATATDLDIRDLSAAQDNVAISDGTDTLAINADGSINTVPGAYTALNNGAVAVSTTALDIVGTALTDRKEMWLANESNKTMYWGENAITSATGFPLHSGSQAYARIGASLTPQIIGSTGSSAEDVRFMEFA
jgi:hypothetical protein